MGGAMNCGKDGEAKGQARRLLPVVGHSASPENASTPSLLGALPQSSKERITGGKRDMPTTAAGSMLEELQKRIQPIRLHLPPLVALTNL
ncbi:hypothetical protein FS837_006218 [Tulasnella sp. UAMH 9824]|nr:hypothetical protein FS837_006218 [Tulasnella sp. UAMH 9824]